MTEIILNTNNIQDIKKYGGRYKKTSKKGLFDEDVYMKKKKRKKVVSSLRTATGQTQQ